jgi:CheY-like chemotaxis protein
MNPSNKSSGPDDLDLTGVRILVVEDSWQLGMAFTSLLKALGAEVLGPVATSADAQRLACEEPPHAALVDFNLRGGELAGALIEQLQQQGIHVVVITGYSDLPGVRRKGIPILHKPVSEEELLGSLRPIIARKKTPG